MPFGGGLEIGPRHRAPAGPRRLGGTNGEGYERRGVRTERGLLDRAWRLGGTNGEGPPERARRLGARLTGSPSDLGPRGPLRGTEDSRWGLRSPGGPSGIEGALLDPSSGF